MKNLLKYTLISILASSFIGCGSSQSGRSDNDSEALKEPTISQAHKIDRANWVGVVPKDIDFFVTNDGNLLSFKLSHISNNQNIDIFINTDNNIQTGYTNSFWGNIGADYLIENNNLYKHAGHGWHWDFVSHISRNQLSDNEVELEVSRNIIGENEEISVIAGVSDQNWNLLGKTFHIYYQLDNIDRLKLNPMPNGYTISEDEQNIIFTIQSPNVSNGQMSTEDIFIDSDFNPESGYKNPRWGNIGADFLIEGNALYRHNGGRWNWSRVANVQREIDGDTLKITVSKNQLNITNRFRSIAGLQNSQWQVIQKYEVTPYVLIHNQKNIDMQKVISQVARLTTPPTFAEAYARYELIGVSPNLKYAILKRMGLGNTSGSFIVYTIDQDSNIHYSRILTHVVMNNNINETDSGDLTVSAQIINNHIFEYKYRLSTSMDDDSADIECTDRFDYITIERLSHNCINQN